jgi:hypothetical protein
LPAAFLEREKDMTHWPYLLIVNRVIGGRLSRDDVRYVCHHFIKLDIEALSVCVALLRVKDPNLTLRVIEIEVPSQISSGTEGQAPPKSGRGSGQ